MQPLLDCWIGFGAASESGRDDAQHYALLYMTHLNERLVWFCLQIFVPLFSCLKIVPLSNPLFVPFVGRPTVCFDHHTHSLIQCWVVLKVYNPVVLGTWTRSLVCREMQ